MKYNRHPATPVRRKPGTGKIDKLRGTAKNCRVLEGAGRASQAGDIGAIKALVWNAPCPPCARWDAVAP